MLKEISKQKAGLIKKDFSEIKKTKWRYCCYWCWFF